MIVYRPHRNTIMTAMAIVIFFAIGYLLLGPKNRPQNGKELLRLSASAVPAPEQLQIFSRLNPRIELEQLPGGDSLFELLVQTGAGRGPDLLADLSPAELNTVSAARVLTDLTTLLPAAEVERIPVSIRRLLSVAGPDGKGGFKPILAIWPASIQNVFIIYNVDLFRQYRIEPPSPDLTWEEYIVKAAQLRTAVSSDLFFGAVGLNPEMLIWEKGGDFFTPDGTVCTLDRPDAIAAMTFYHHLIHRDHVEPVEAQSGADTQELRMQLFLQRRTAMLWVSRQALTPLRQSLPVLTRRQQQWQRQYPDRPFPGPFPFEVGASLVPRFADGPRWSNVAVSGVGLNRHTRNRKAAEAFFHFLCSTPYLQSFRQFPTGVPAQKDLQSESQLQNQEYPEETIINRIAIASIPFSRDRQRSIFVPDLFVEREFQKTRFTIASDPHLTPDGIAALMRRLTAKIHQKMTLTMAHDQPLQRMHQSMVAAPPLSRKKIVTE